MGIDPYGVQMSDAEIAAFLSRRGHGVLSFGGEKPYGLPISFGYDPTTNRCVLQLVFGPDSRKQAYLEHSGAVSLAAYEWASVDDWRSVLVDGELVPIDPESDAAVEAADVFSEYGSVVGLSVFDEPAEELDAEWFELHVDELHGYQSPTRAD